MGEEIKTKIFTQEERAKVRNRSAFMLPDNPSQKGLNANQIKRTFYEPLLHMFDLMDVYESFNEDEKVKIQKQIDDIIKGIITVGKAYNDENGDNIPKTYAKQTVVDNRIDELINAITFSRLGLLKVKAYDEKTGTIKFTYNKDVTKTLEYNESTGVIKLTY